MEVFTLCFNAILTALELTAVTVFVARTVELRRPWLYCILAVGVCTALYLVKYFMADFYQMWSSILTILVILLIPLAFTKETPGRTLLISLLYMTTILISDVVTTTLVGILYPGDWQVMIGELIPMLAIKIFVLVFNVLLCFILFFLLQRRRRLQKRQINPLPYILVPMVQLIAMEQFLYMLQANGLLSLPPILGSYIFLVLACVVSNICFFLALSKMQREQSLREQTALAERQLAVQLAYYTRLEDNITAANRIRHDIKNQLRAAYILMERGDTAQVKLQLDQLSQLIENRVGSIYTKNLVVDAVLMDKAARCQTAGVPFDAAINLPAELPIDGVQLCSLFANVMDNAISACEHTEKPFIRLQSFLRSGCLIVCCQNAAKPMSDKRAPNADALLPEHGLGLGILKSIAEQYDGSIDITWEEDVFKLTLLLILPENADRTASLQKEAQQFEHADK